MVTSFCRFPDVSNPDSLVGHQIYSSLCCYNPMIEITDLVIPFDDSGLENTANRVDKELGLT